MRTTLTSLLLLMFTTIGFSQSIPDSCSYLLDCSFNGNANDNSDNTHPSTVYGPTLTADKDDNPYSAYLFDGIDDYIEVNNHNAIMDADVFTIACWARMDGTGGGTGAKNTLFSHRDIANPGTQGVVTVLADNGAGNIAFALKGSTTATSTIVLTIPSVSYIDWHHYAFVFDETDTMRIYVDGIELDKRNTLDQETSLRTLMM